MKSHKTALSTQGSCGIILIILILCASVWCFTLGTTRQTLALQKCGAPTQKNPTNLFAKGFGAAPEPRTPSEKKHSKEKPAKPKGTTYNKAEQTKALEDLATSSAKTILGRAVASSPSTGDTFWDLIPALVASKFPHATEEDLTRVAGFVKHTLNPALPLEDDIVQDKWRPHEEIHAYMPGLGPREPFIDTSKAKLCQSLEENYETIAAEYEALLEEMKQLGKDRFQSVTSMNYNAGWKTVILFYNGHRIPGFPYHLCPVTTRILETVPLAGRIAGFSRQQPSSGIPLHSDGNNMWLTCQMGIKIPEGKKAYIRVGPETRYWSNGKCLLYDTTYEHETVNGSTEEERVVLHVDFFNTLAMKPSEIQVMQYIYEMREKFLKAEGVAKVGAQIL